jgi:hypothetical protein
MSKPLEASPSVSHAKFLDATATLAVSALRSLLFALPLATTLLLSACVSSGLELAAVATADPASGDAGSGSIVTGSLAPIDAAGAGKAATQAAPTKHAAANKKARGPGPIVILRVG